MCRSTLLSEVFQTSNSINKSYYKIYHGPHLMKDEKFSISSHKKYVKRKNFKLLLNVYENSHSYYPPKTIFSKNVTDRNFRF